MIVDSTMSHLLNERVIALESYFKSDAILYYGEISPLLFQLFRDFIEDLASDEYKKDLLVVNLHTPGGSAETVERMVNVIRHHYKEVYFIVPDEAMSAGTIFCMSGDKIYMDYSSSLGPIDPQIYNGKSLVPALGYLDQVEKIIKKSIDGTISPVEIEMIRSVDLANLNYYEQAKNLTITLLKNWLVQYKFKDWVVHESTPELVGRSVTEEEKRARAEDIAKLLSDNGYWHSHGRNIDVATLRDVLKLKIEDYSKDVALRTIVRAYNDLAIDYIGRQGYPFYLHSRQKS